MSIDYSIKLFPRRWFVCVTFHDYFSLKTVRRPLPKKKAKHIASYRCVQIHIIYTMISKAYELNETAWPLFYSELFAIPCLSLNLSAVVCCYNKQIVWRNVGENIERERSMWKDKVWQKTYFFPYFFASISFAVWNGESDCHCVHCIGFSIQFNSNWIQFHFMWVVLLFSLVLPSTEEEKNWDLCSWRFI